ncbi:hypothetical protein [Spiroplasma endosymbiont of Danaus chrysippus]|uniref:hypothetical protein n=1 Tax=Spiroplasma endosymbiont of Danaus chrysippus TaxID=2691041 RepID=UPI00157B54AB|nr:hypothetical protein [Spiroplasma endosymbiont of Danaus chrysippus]
MEYKLEYCKNKKCNFNELLVKNLNARIEFLEYQIEEINLNQLNLWELDVLRGQIKELNILKNNIKEWLRRGREWNE